MISPINLFGLKFLDQNFFRPNFFRPNFFDQNFVWSKNSYESLRPKFDILILLRPKIYFERNYQPDITLLYSVNMYTTIKQRQFKWV